MPVLCLPLLENSSRKPWLTHPDRIIFMPLALQTRTPSGAPQPGCLLSASTMEITLYSPLTSPNERAMELKLWVEQKHGENVWQHMWELMLNLIVWKTPGHKELYEMEDTRYVRCACVWAIGHQHHQQACPVEENEPYSTWRPVVVSTNPAHSIGGLMPVLCLSLLENSSKKPWLTHPDRIIFMPEAVQTRTPSGAPQPACLLGGAAGPPELLFDLNSMD